MQTQANPSKKKVKVTTHKQISANMRSRHKVKYLNTRKDSKSSTYKQIKANTTKNKRIRKHQQIPGNTIK